MKAKDVVVGGEYLTVVVGQLVHVRVTGEVEPRTSRRGPTRYRLERRDNGFVLPKPRTASALREATPWVDAPPPSASNWVLKKAERLAPILAILKETGSLADGETHEEQVRIPTTSRPAPGSIGGELRTFGGRKRYQCPGTRVRVSVGWQTVCIYRVQQGSDPEFLAHLATKGIDQDGLRGILRRLTGDGQAAGGGANG